MSKSSQSLDVITLDKKYNYKVKRQGSLYLVEFSDVHFSRRHDLPYTIEGDVSLGKLVNVNSRVWKPRIINPFASEKRIIEVVEKQFRFDYLLICKKNDSHGFENFYEQLNSRMMNDRNALLPFDSALDLFMQGYKHYEECFKQFELSNSRSLCRNSDDDNEIKSGECENE